VVVVWAKGKKEAGMYEVGRWYKYPEWKPCNADFVYVVNVGTSFFTSRWDDAEKQFVTFDDEACAWLILPRRNDEILL
jgi:hypothetical protein